MVIGKGAGGAVLSLGVPGFLGPLCYLTSVSLTGTAMIKEGENQDSGVTGSEQEMLEATKDVVSLVQADLSADLG